MMETMDSPHFEEGTAPHVIEIELEIQDEEQPLDDVLKSHPTEEKCRVCLSPALEGSLFIEGLDSKLSACLAVAVRKDDRLPSGICDTCKQDLEISYKFKTLAERSYSVLLCRQITENNSLPRPAYDSVANAKNKNAIDVSNIQNLKDLNSVFFEQPQRIVSKLADKIQETITLIENPHITVNNTVIKKASNAPTDDISVELDEEENLEDAPLEISTETFDHDLAVSRIKVQKFEDYVERKMLIEKKEIKVMRNKEEDVMEIFTEDVIEDGVTSGAMNESSFMDNYVDGDYYLEDNPSNFYTTTDSQGVVLKIPDIPLTTVEGFKEEPLENKNKIRYLNEEDAKENAKYMMAKSKEKHICPICGFMTFNIGIHMTKHEHKQLICPECNKTFTHKNNYETHIKKHYDIKDNVCEICGASYLFAKSLIRHKLVHTGEKKYHCDKCPMKFYVKSDLTRHLRVHAGYKPFVCTICSMAFNAKHQLLSHVRMHTGEKPFVCEVCDVAFTYKVNLNNHSLKVHNLDLKFKSIHKLTHETLSQLHKDQNPNVEYVPPQKPRKKGVVKQYEQFIKPKKR